MNRPRHHDGSRGFRNNHPTDRHGGFDALLWFARFAVKRYRRMQFPVHPPHLESFHSEAGDALTWIGHSTFLLQLGEYRLLTDPHFSERASPLQFAGPQRLTPPAMALKDLPPVHLALISHNHYDHLDEASVVALARHHPELQFVVPLGLKAWFEKRRIERVVELDWWQHCDIGGLRVHAVPAQHFSGRTARDRNQTLWCGFIVESEGRRIYFAGDTGYCPDFAEIGQRFAPIDLAMIPIGAYEPRWFMKPMHVDPDEAVKIHQDIGSRQSVAMHWGTFRLTEEPLDDPPHRLRRALQTADIPEDDFWVLQHGETRKLVSAHR